MSEEKNTIIPETPIPAATPARNEVEAKLCEFGALPDSIKAIREELGVDTLDELATLTAEDLISKGMKLAKARNLLASLQKPATTTTNTSEVQSQQLEALLPVIPTDESWLNSLKTGGILKVDESSYIAAIRAALADKAGLYNVPEALAKAMEKYADETEEQVDPVFFSLRKTLTRRTYGGIFAAIDGLDGNFITEGRRKEFLSRIRTTLWPAITESYQVLNGWYQNWRASFTDPSVMLAALSGIGMGAGIGLTTPPDTSILHDAGDSLVNSINRIFRGTGVQVAAALAYEAKTISSTLEDSRLPSMVGVKNREMMLKKIGASVSSNYVRLEQNLVKYVLSFVKYNSITSDVEVNYFAALWQLGSQINWAELGSDNSNITGLTGKNVL